jgi:hypothetical protein
VDDVGQAAETGDHANAIGKLLREDRVFLCRFTEQAAEPAEVQAGDAKSFAHRRCDRLVARLGQQVGHVLAEPLEAVGRHAPAPEFLADVEQGNLSACLVVGQARDAPDLGHALDLHPGAALDAHVHVLARRPVAAPNVLRAAAHATDDLADLGDLEWRVHLRLGHDLDERHAEPIGEVDAIMSAVRDLAAGVLLEGELADTDATVAVLKPAIDTEDRGALEAGGNGAVEVLLARDVEFIDDAQTAEHADLEGDVDGLGIDEERRRVVELVRADGVVMDAVVNVLPRLLLHEGGAVVLAHLRERRPHVTEDLRIEVTAVLPGRAPAEELGAGLELLVDFEARLEADGGVVLGGHLVERLEGERLHGRISGRDPRRDRMFSTASMVAREALRQGTAARMSDSCIDEHAPGRCGRAARLEVR